MNSYFPAVVRLAGISTAICLVVGASPVVAAVKIIGDFEGNMASAYTVPDGDDPDTDPDPILWTTTPGGGAVTDMTFDFINVNDVDYVGGVTSGEQALLITHPIDWNGGPYLRLHGSMEFIEDMASFPYLMFDLTTYGGPATPEEGPASRQIFTIFNNPLTGFYDANFDSDIQHDPAVAAFDAEFLTSAVVIDMTGPDPAVSGDGMNFMNLKAQEALVGGTPPDYWQLLMVFQGEDNPIANPIQTVIDNVRFCSDLACTPDGLAGDFNDDGNVDAADYVVWRKNVGTMNELANDEIGGEIGPAHYSQWRQHFGESAPGAGGLGGYAVPEPSSFLLAMGAILSLATVRRRAA